MSTLLPVYVLIDLETAGAIPVQDRIIKIGSIRYESGSEAGRWKYIDQPTSEHSPFI